MIKIADIKNSKPQMIMDKNNEMVVSVIMITYGHEMYIEQAIRGVFTQKTDFPIELIIANDCSPDNTDALVKKILLETPASISVNYTRHSNNMGVMPNFAWAINQASGKYIALCEGDDFWNDPLKLQKQVNALENNPTINICTHPSLRLYGDVLKKDSYGYWGDVPKVISAKQVIKNYASTAGLQAIMIRNKKTAELNEIVKNLLGGHSTIQMFYAIPDGLYYLPDYMAVYRKGSVSSISKVLFNNDSLYLERQKKNWKGLQSIDEYTKFHFTNEFAEALRFRAIDAIGTGFLSISQKIGLIKDYKLHKHPVKLSKALLVRYYDMIRRPK